MLTAYPNSLFSWDFTLRDGATTLARLDIAWLRERATVEVRGEDFVFSRDSMLRGEFSLRQNSQTVAHAFKTNVFTRSFDIHTQGRTLRLSAAAPWRRTFRVLEDGQEIGRIAPVHLWGRKAWIRLPDDLPPPVQAFIFWLVVLMWRRAARSSHSNAAGAHGGSIS